ncbi:hypothetical protein [Geobacter sp.]|uniref:hypothetical protein n=1 Tax=Geobacter sp. TaxID=46610 RepID=UPI00260251DD|nr:hypothetical protein [Geobacter sp.]
MLFPNDSTLHCIALINRIEVYHYDEDDRFEIMAACKGLDCIGFVHDMEFVWQPETPQEKDDVLATIASGNYYTASGRFGGYVDGVIYLYDPECNSLPEGVRETVAEVFEVNGK